MESCKGCKYYSAVTDTCDYCDITGRVRGCKALECNKRIDEPRGYGYISGGLNERECLAACDETEYALAINQIIAERLEEDESYD